MIRNKMLGVGIPVLVCAMAAHASTITYQTPAGATTSGPVNASATFVTGAGSVSITLNDLQANPTDVAQLISDLDFTFSNGATVGTLSSSSGQEITVNSGGTFVLGGTVATGWVLNNNISGGLQLNVLGTSAGPSHLIIGPPGGATYSNANGSIAGNGPHNPFLNQTATFLITGLSGVTADTTITSATFSFGTTAGVNVTGCVVGAVNCGSSTIPEPTSLLLGGSGLLGLFLLRRRSSAR